MYLSEIGNTNKEKKLSLLKMVPLYGDKTSKKIMFIFYESLHFKF